jgi:hypothetical protein
MLSLYHALCEQVVRKSMLHLWECVYQSASKVLFCGCLVADLGEVHRVDVHAHFLCLDGLLLYLTVMFTVVFGVSPRMYIY